MDLWSGSWVIERFRTSKDCDLKRCLVPGLDESVIPPDLKVFPLLPSMFYNLYSTRLHLVSLTCFLPFSLSVQGSKTFLIDTGDCLRLCEKTLKLVMDPLNSEGSTVRLLHDCYGNTTRVNFLMFVRLLWGSYYKNFY